MSESSLEQSLAEQCAAFKRDFVERVGDKPMLDRFEAIEKAIAGYQETFGAIAMLARNPTLKTETPLDEREPEKDAPAPENARPGEPRNYSLNAGAVSFQG